MESNSHYRVVGLSVLLLLAGLIAAGVWLSIGFNKLNYNLFAIYMNESVSGLTVESLVKYNGVKVGYIKKITIDPNYPQTVRLVIAIDSKTPVTPNTYATLITQGLTGSTYLGLGWSKQNIGSLRKIPNEPYPVIMTKPSFYSEIETTLRDIGNAVKEIFSDKNIENVNQIIASLKNITKVINDNDENINKSLSKLPVVIDNFGQMIDSITDASDEVKKTMKSGKEGFDKITRQAITPTVLFLRRLDGIAENLEQISEQIKQNPSVIIRGTTDPQPGPGE